MSELPAKYSNLIMAKKGNVLIPKTMLLSEEELRRGEYKNELKKFLEKFPGRADFIVRSSVSSEDASDLSLAGHFHSSAKMPRSKLEEIIWRVFLKNKRILKELGVKGRVNLMVQEYITGKFGGVLFYPWKYFDKHFLLEISKGGSEKAVAGEEVSFALLSLDKSLPDILPIKRPEKIPVKDLRDKVRKLNKIFPFPVDVEWTLNQKNEVVILQIRPITVRVEAIIPANKEQMAEQEKTLGKISGGIWTQNSLSESLGVISPLSFSLFRDLYQSSRPVLQEMGFRARKADFLARAVSGAVYISREKEEEFFALKSPLSHFWLSFYQNKRLREIIEFCNDNTKGRQKFDYKFLSRIFSYWQMANIYCAMVKPVSGLSESPLTVNEYELAYQREIVQPQKLPDNWNKSKDCLKGLFLLELEKLKKKIARKTNAVFMDYKEIGMKVSPGILKKRYRDDLQASIIEFPGKIGGREEESDSGVVRVSGQKSISGKALVIKNPRLYNKKIPDGAIIVAPFFNNNWIREMKRIKGVVLENGGLLSHSAIVARETGLPYLINFAGACAKIKNGSKLKLDPLKRTLNSK